MSGRFWPGPLSEGERRLALALCCMAMFGAAVGLVVNIRIANAGGSPFPFDIYDAWVVLSGAVGGASGLWFMRHRMGQRGLDGFVKALSGVLGMSLLGPVIGGSLALPLYGTMFGPFTLGVILFGAPVLALGWLFILIMVHVLLLGWTAERDSIFVAPVTQARSQRRRRPGAPIPRP